MEKKLFDNLEEQIAKEITFYLDDTVSLQKKKEKLDVSIMVNKYANTLIQYEALQQRKTENEIRLKETTRLNKRFNNGK